MEQSREQRLVDLIYSFAIHAAHYMHGKSNEEVAEWIRPQLKTLGWNTIPMGMAWGKIIPNEPESKSNRIEIYSPNRPD